VYVLVLVLVLAECQQYSTSLSIKECVSYSMSTS